MELQFSNKFVLSIEKPNSAKGFRFGRCMGLWLQTHKAEHFLRLDGPNRGWHGGEERFGKEESVNSLIGMV